jgi:uncharacterized protein
VSNGLLRNKTFPSKGGVAMNFAGVVQTMTTTLSVEQRVGKYDWDALSQELSNYGCAVMKRLLSQGECREIAQLYDEEAHFRSQVHMGRHGFGKGEYRYFKYPFTRFD